MHTRDLRLSEQPASFPNAVSVCAVHADIEAAQYAQFTARHAALCQPKKNVNTATTSRRRIRARPTVGVTAVVGITEQSRVVWTNQRSRRVAVVAQTERTAATLPEVCAVQLLRRWRPTQKHRTTWRQQQQQNC